MDFSRWLVDQKRSSSHQVHTSILEVQGPYDAQCPCLLVIGWKLRLSVSLSLFLRQAGNLNFNRAYRSTCLFFCNICNGINWHRIVERRLAYIYSNHDKVFLRDKLHMPLQEEKILLQSILRNRSNCAFPILSGKENNIIYNNIIIYFICICWKEKHKCSDRTNRPTDQLTG